MQIMAVFKEGSNASIEYRVFDSSLVLTFELYLPPYPKYVNLIKRSLPCRPCWLNDAVGRRSLVDQHHCCYTPELDPGMQPA